MSSSSAAAAARNADRMLDEADVQVRRGDLDAAFECTRRAAHAGSARAWTRLGKMYSRGEGVKRNSEDAATCYERAARMGDLRGRGLFAMCLITATGVDPELENGLRMLRAVADAGDTTAMKNCAWIYENGEPYGVPRDDAEAKRWRVGRSRREKEKERSSAYGGKGRSRPSGLVGTKSTGSGVVSSVVGAGRKHQSASGIPRRGSGGGGGGGGGGGSLLEEYEKRDRTAAALEGRTPAVVAGESAGFLYDSLDVGDDKVIERTVTPLSSPTAHDGAAVAGTSMQRANSGPLARAARQEAEIRRKERQEELERQQVEENRKRMEKQRFERDEAQRQREREEEKKHREAAIEAEKRKKEEQARADEIAEAAKEDRRSRAEDAAKKRDAAAQARKEEQEKVLADRLAAEERKKQTEAIRKRDAASAAEARAAAAANAEAAAKSAAAAKARAEARTTESDVGARAKLEAEAERTTAERQRAEAEAAFARQAEDLRKREEALAMREKELLRREARAAAPTAGAGSATPSAVMSATEGTAAQVGSRTSNGNIREGDEAMPPSAPGRSEPGSEAGAMQESSVSQASRPVEADAGGGNSVGVDAQLEAARRDAAQQAEVRSEQTSDVQRRWREAADNNGSTTESDERIRAIELRKQQQNEAAAKAFEAASEVGLHTSSSSGQYGEGPSFGLGEGGEPSAPAEGAHSAENGLGATEMASWPELSPVQKNEYMRMARGLNSTYPKDLLNPKAHSEVYAFLDKMQLIAWKCREAGQYLIDEGSVDLTCQAMQTYPLNAEVQERGIHAIVRLVRAADSFQRESVVVAHSPREFALLNRPDSRQSGGSGGSGSAGSGRGGKGKLTLNPVQTVVNAMRQHPEVMTLQLAGCNVLALFISIGDNIRPLIVDYRGHIAIVDALRVRGRASNFDRLYCVHEVACRALFELCRPPNGEELKEITGDAGGVEQVVVSVGRWNLKPGVPRNARLTVTRHACSVLALLTKDSVRNAQRALQANALLYLIRVLEANYDNGEVCLIAMEAMGYIAAVGSETVYAELENSNALQVLVTVLRHHPNNPTLVRNCLLSMRKFCASGALSYRRVIGNGGVEACITPMRNYSDDPVVQENACSVLAVLCRDEPTGKDAAAREGAVELLTSMLRTHASNISTVELGCSAITSICAQHAGNLDAARQLDTAGAVVSVLKRHGSTQATVATVAASAIRVLTLAKDPALSQRLLTLSAPEMLLQTMGAHDDRPKVQEHACFALSALCAKNDTLPKRISRGGAVDLLLALLRRYIGEPNVVYAIMCAIRSMVSKSREVVLQFIVSKLPEALQQALQQHMGRLPQNDHVMIVLCATINVCGFKIVAHKNELGAAGIVEKLRELMTVAADAEDESVLRPTLSTLCTLLINSGDNQDRFQEVDGVEGVLEIAQRWSRNEAVVELCCVVLRHSCGEHDGNRDEIKANNGIRTLQGVLQNHPQNPGVVTAACQALAVICHGDQELQMAAGMLNTIPSTVTAMRNFENVASVQAGACSFLFAVTQDNPRNKARVVRCGGRTAVVRAIEGHPANEDVNNYGAHALLQIEDTIVTHANGGASGPGGDGGAEGDTGVGGGGPEEASGTQTQRKSGFFRTRRKSRDGRSQHEQPELYEIADGTSDAPSPPVVLASSGVPQPSTAVREERGKGRKGRRGRSKSAVEPAVAPPVVMGGTENGGARFGDRPGGAPGPAPKRGSFFRRRKSVSSLASSREGSEVEEGTSGTGDGDGVGSVSSGGQQRRMSFPFIRRGSSKTRSSRRNSVDRVADDGNEDGDGLDDLAIDGRQGSRGRNRHDGAPRYLAGDRKQYAAVGGLVPPGVGRRNAYQESDNDIAQLQDLEGLPMAGNDEDFVGS